MELIKNEGLIRIAFFFGGLGIFWLLGLVYSYRKLDESKKSRWLSNIGLTLVNTVLIRLILPTGLVALSTFVENNHFGLFNFIGMSTITNTILSFFVLDCVIYFQHVVFHKVPLLWRVHQVHHSDTGFDATTALRFHPIEIVLSIGLKAITVVAFGISPAGVIVFEILLNLSAIFNHSNFSLPQTLESFFRKWVVTPDMHRIHHSILVEETNSNYGFFLPWWDRVFKTYRKDSTANLQLSKIGVERFRETEDQRLDHLLIQPFRKQ